MTHLETVYKLACDLRIELMESVNSGIGGNVKQFDKQLSRIADWALIYLSDEQRILEEYRKDNKKP